jgi:hypothetical protein
MDDRTAKSIDKSLKSIAASLDKIERNTRPVDPELINKPVKKTAEAAFGTVIFSEGARIIPLSPDKKINAVNMFDEMRTAMEGENG